MPGRIFHVRGRDADFLCPYVRVAFCNVSHENLREGARRLGKVLRNAADASKGKGGQGSGSVMGTRHAEGGRVNGASKETMQAGMAALPMGV